MTAPVMIVGATGVFGSRLLHQLVTQGIDDFILAGRNEAKAHGLLDELRAKNIGARFVRLDREKPDASLLRELAPGVIVDAAGPFQHSTLALAKAAIAAQVNYIDLADARDFAARIPALDEAARHAGVAVITGASSTPALSHAVLDHFTKGWQRIDKILVAIAPGNRAPRGFSVVEAILSYVGTPVPVFREAAFTPVRGWGQNEWVEIAGVGPRQAAVCETPDLDLFVSRYRPLVSAEFKAGLELGVMHNSLRMLSWLRAGGLLPRLVPMARPLLWLAKLLEGFGSDRGGMLVEVFGLDAKNVPTRLRWSLAATTGLGPHVPALPAAILIGKLPVLPPGAYAAAGHLPYLDVVPQLGRLGIATQVSRVALPTVQVFERALGASWTTLPPTTRLLHTAIPSAVWQGRANIQGAETALGRAIAKLFGFPEGAQNVPVRVSIESDGQRELWARTYPTRVMRSVLTAPDPARSTVEERMGPFRFRLRLKASAQGIDMQPERVFLGPLALPHWCLPMIVATERVDAAGQHVFDVLISLWPLGRLVHYQGYLAPVARRLP